MSPVSKRHGQSPGLPLRGEPSLRPFHCAPQRPRLDVFHAAEHALPLAGSADPLHKHHSNCCIHDSFSFQPIWALRHAIPTTRFYLTFALCAHPDENYLCCTAPCCYQASGLQTRLALSSHQLILSTHLGQYVSHCNHPGGKGFFRRPGRRHP